MTILANRLHELGFTAEVGMVITEPRTGSRFHVSNGQSTEGRTWYLVGDAVPLADAERIATLIKTIASKTDAGP